MILEGCFSHYHAPQDFFKCLLSFISSNIGFRRNTYLILGGPGGIW